MSYYDNVKDNIKNESTNGGGSSSSGSSGDSGASKGNFDTLREAASETDPEEEGGDDTPIEVLEEDGISRNSPKREERGERQEKQRENRGQDGNSGHGENRSKDRSTQSDRGNSSGSGNPLKSKTGASGSSSDPQDLSGVEDRLDTIIEQNQEMIEILRSFAE